MSLNSWQHLLKAAGHLKHKIVSETIFKMHSANPQQLCAY